MHHAEKSCKISPMATKRKQMAKPRQKESPVTEVTTSKKSRTRNDLGHCPAGGTQLGVAGMYTSQ
jgi:hypothetical protein